MLKTLYELKRQYCAKFIKGNVKNKDKKGAEKCLRQQQKYTYNIQTLNDNWYA